ncbi:MAG TPA: SurA N-terminal domain-containing protein [Acidobacteriaceae bacterium]|jgi:peptidyl-prolyl cis-trans isomerase SurA|nr:SurA N-terminal domain-containing protein [Acidobacteriaceae bacterium]
MLKSVRLPAVLLAVSFGLLTGCHEVQQNGVVATVNGHPILRSDLDKDYTAQLANNPQTQTPSADQAESLRLNILHELIVEEIIAQRAAKLGLTATDAEVDAKIDELKASYTEEQFRNKLQASGQTLDSLRRSVRQNLTINKLLNKEINSKITVSDADVTNYYNAHKAEFNLIETQYHLAQIQVTDQPASQITNLQNNKASGDLDARKKIQALKNRIDAGEDFGSLAAQFSEQPNTAPNGGDMGFFPESQVKSATDPQTFAAIMKLKPGETTDILPLLDAQTHKPAGYAIYRLISKEPAGQRELSDPRVQQSIRQQLHDSRSQLLKNAYFEILRDEAKVRNFYAEQVFKDATQ